MQGNQAENKGFQILDKVVKDAKAFWVCGFSDIHQGSYLGRLEGCQPTCSSIYLRREDTNLERYVIIAQADLELLPPVLVLLWPFGIVFPILNGQKLFPRCWVETFLTL